MVGTYFGRTIRQEIARRWEKKQREQTKKVGTRKRWRNIVVVVVVVVVVVFVLCKELDRMKPLLL